MTTVTSICPICNKQFSAKKARRFCSIRCRNIHNGRQLKPKRVESACPICGKSFTARPNPDGTPHSLCCSNKCARISTSNKLRKYPKEYICPICHKRFENKHRGHPRVYCSRKCAGIGKRKRAKVISSICDYCGKEFIQPDPSNWNSHDPQRFCSEICKGKGIAKERGLNLRKKVTFICENCGKPFTRNARADREYHFCSRKCYWVEHRGENHHCWQGGTDRYYGPNWDQQRDRALKRDDYKCQICGTTEDGMNVHHIILRSEFDHDWEAMNDLSNLITLCQSCHTKVHMGGCQLELAS